jgi:hypothetical protein
MALDTKKLGQYARLYLARKKLKEKYEQLGKQLKKIEGPLIEHMFDQDEPIEKLSLRGGITLNIEETIWAQLIPDENGVVDKNKIAAALEKVGMGHIASLGINHQSLSAYLRELSAAGEPIPPELEGLVRANPTEKLKARRL